MRKLVFIAALAVFAAADAYVVKVENLPANTEGYKVRLSSRKTGAVLDSAVVNGPGVILSSSGGTGEWCDIGYSYPIDGGVRTDYVVLFPDADTITVDVAPGHLAAKVTGGPLNDSMTHFKEITANLPKKADGVVDVYETRRLFLNEIDGNLGNAYGAYVLQSIEGIMADSVWLDAFGRLTPENQTYPSLQKIKQIKLQKMANTAGKKFSDLKVLTAEGDTARMYDYVGRGKYVLVDFWASWCGPCRKEAHETLEPLYEKYRNDDRFMILGVVTAEQPENAREVVAGKPYPWMQVIDIDNQASATYGFSTIPQIMLIGPDGTLLYREIRGQGIFKAVEKSLR
jgi:thiol-disulfide isomerase/thioredoxin